MELFLFSVGFTISLKRRLGARAEIGGKRVLNVHSSSLMGCCPLSEAATPHSGAHLFWIKSQDVHACLLETDRDAIGTGSISEGISAGMKGESSRKRQC